MFEFKSRHPKWRRWTIGAVDCYKRGCRCPGCFLNGYFESQKKCQMKWAVIELVRLMGIPKENLEYLKGPHYKNKFYKKEE